MKTYSSNSDAEYVSKQAVFEAMDSCIHDGVMDIKELATAIENLYSINIITFNKGKKKENDL